jgi:hypothetical protein
MTLCTETGERIYDDAKEPVDTLKWSVLAAIFNEALRVMKLTKEGVDDEKKG